MMSNGTNTSFGALKQIDAGVLNVGYAEAGKSDAPAVLLLHGWPYDIHSYIEVAPALASKGYRVIVPYLRGYGTTRFLSSDTLRNGQQSVVAVDIITLMDVLRIERAILAGSDWGARTADIIAGLWPERCKALVSVTGYLITNLAANKLPIPPQSEWDWWYQYYFTTERGVLGLTKYRYDLGKFVWKFNSPTWKFSEATYNLTAAAFNNPDYVSIVIGNYRWRLSLAPSEPQYASIEKRLQEVPVIAVPTIPIDGKYDPFTPAGDGAAYRDKFSGKYSHKTPPWFGEAALLVQHLRRQGILEAIGERVRFARRRFGHYEVIDFAAVIFGYAISGERTLEAFYKRLHPFAPAFMALFGRECLPSRSTLSRFLASLTQPPVEALRTLFLEDLLARPLTQERQTGGLGDRAGKERVVFDIDGTREAARQRALPKTEELPAPHRRLDEMCAPGYTGRKRGEIVRTRTTILQAHTSQWFGSFANPGNGFYREELRRAVAAIGLYSKAYGLPEELILLRLDGLYGTGAVIADLAGFSYVTRGKDYTVLDRAEVQSRLHLPADQQFTRPESDLVRTLYDCPDVLVGPTGQRSRVVVATHPTNARKSRIGLTRSGLVYELFFSNLPQSAFTAADVVALYLHRGAFEPVLADEDQEQASDRWCSHSPAGQEAWQIINQWLWNLRLAGTGTSASS